MTEIEALNILDEMRDGYTFEACKICVTDNKYSEKEGICKSKTCEYLKAINKVTKQVTKYKQEIDKLNRLIKIKNGYLDMIYALGFDYDGYREANSLMGLIDELVDLADKGLNNDDKSVMSWGGNKYFNILHEEIGEIKDE